MCEPSEALRCEFWKKFGPRLRELEILFTWSEEGDYAHHVAELRQVTQFIRDYCRGLRGLDLEAPDSVDQILAECITSFPELDFTRILDFSVEQVKLIAESCAKVRVHLVHAHEPTAHEVIQFFRDRIDALSVTNMKAGGDDLEGHNADLEAALSDCSTIKKYDCNSLSLMSYLYAKPKHELVEFTITIPGEKIMASHLDALTKSTGNLRKIQMDNITSMLPSAVWKEFFNANSHFEEVDLAFFIGRDDDAMPNHLCVLLKLINPLQKLHHVKLLHRNRPTPSKTEIKNIKNASVPFRHRKILLLVNGIVINPIGYATSREADSYYTFIIPHHCTAIYMRWL